MVMVPSRKDAAKRGCAGSGSQKYCELAGQVLVEP